MNKKKYSLYIAGGILLLIVVYLVVTYNSLVKKEEKVKFTWSEVQNAYARRLDLIPNLVNVVRGNANFEQTVLTQVTEARSRVIQSNTGSEDASGEALDKQTAAQNDLASATNRVIITVEKYPDLKGTKAFLDLQTDLVGTERRIKVARKNLNEAVRIYNTSVKSFPTNLVAGILGFSAKSGFTSDAGAEKATEIKF